MSQVVQLTGVHIEKRAKVCFSVVDAPSTLLSCLGLPDVMVRVPYLNEGIAIVSNLHVVGTVMQGDGQKVFVFEAEIYGMEYWDA